MLAKWSCFKNRRNCPPNLLLKPRKGSQQKSALQSHLNSQNKIKKIMGYQQYKAHQLHYRLFVASTHSAALRSVLSTSIRHPLGGSFSIWL